MKKISVLGSTGSIGTQTLDVVREHNDIEIVSLSCGRNIELIEKQAREFQPKYICVWNEKDALSLMVKVLC